MCVVRCRALPPEVVGTSISCNSVVAEYDGNKEKRGLEEAKVSHVRHILIARLHSVLSGARARDFGKWASKQGDLKVVSMHGVDEEELDSNFGDHLEVVPSSNGLFPDDAINLALVPIPELPSQYQGMPFHLEEGGISVINLIFRSIRLGFNFAPVASTAMIALVSPYFREKVWFSWVASCLAASGPAFIKWGQWASTRSDMFPESLCAALSQLTNDAPTHSWKHTKKVMESSLGLPPDSLLKVFDSFDQKPLASGSIAQVHKACLNGTSVVAKVRHPNVAKLIAMDFRLMRIAAGIADILPALSWLHIRETVEQFSHTMAAQAHLNVEGHHLEVLNFNFRNWPHVRFPRPFYATSAVIIETFEAGKIVTAILDAYETLASQAARNQGTLTVEEIVDDKASEESYPQSHQVVPMDVAKFIVSTGLSLYLKMLLIDRQMHADLHAGNIMLDLTNEVNEPRLSSTEALPTASSPGGHRRLAITLVDAGMVAQLSEDESTNFIGLLCCLGDGNGRVAAQCALRFSKESQLTEEEQLAFADDMDELFKLTCRGYGTNVSAGEVLRGVLGLIRKHKVRIDANYATLVVNCLCIEGLAQRVCPAYNLVDAAKPLLQAYQGLCYNKDGALVANPSSVS
ncbi:kinase [Fragilaria crotonensis]|nr:kinase [Fragilaria crotonensis]